MSLAPTELELDEQARALQTYLKRIYFPFIVREPELFKADGHTGVLFMHAPAAHQSEDASICLGILLVLPSLIHLPAALEAAEKAVSGLGALFQY